ncbi:MAG TPA: FixH family protein [Gemmatimonadaceae bacterium]|nr:FixH family protein [Gemmatimonadaceae bacterium]
MMQHPVQSTFRKWARISGLFVVVIALALGCVIAGAADTIAARPATTIPSIALVSHIPSHNHAYTASISPRSGVIGLNQQRDWMVEVRAFSGMPVGGATLTLKCWMPDDPEAGTSLPKVTEIGGGRYRVEGMRFDRRGWWNLKLRISGAAGTDSLAFNLVL